MPNRDFSMNIFANLTERFLKGGGVRADSIRFFILETNLQTHPKAQ